MLYIPARRSQTSFCFPSLQSPEPTSSFNFNVRILHIPIREFPADIHLSPSYPTRYSPLHSQSPMQRANSPLLPLPPISRMFRAQRATGQMFRHVRIPLSHVLRPCRNLRSEYVLRMMIRGNRNRDCIFPRIWARPREAVITATIITTTTIPLAGVAERHVFLVRGENRCARVWRG